MRDDLREELRRIRTFPQFAKYLRDHLDWPVETDSFDDLTFDYEPKDLGLDPKTSAKIRHIRQLRPLPARRSTAFTTRRAIRWRLRPAQKNSRRI